MRGTSEISGIGDIRSMGTIGARSIPKVQRSNYLELYVLQSEKDRLGREIFGLEKRMGSAKRRMNSVNQRIEGLQKETREEKTTKTRGETPAKPLKKMKANY